MYYENIMSEMKKLKTDLDTMYKEFAATSCQSKERNLRKRADAEGTTGRNLATVYEEYDYKTLIKKILVDVRNNNFTKIELGDYLIVPTMVFNGTTFTNWRFDVVGINSYNYYKTDIPGIVLTSHMTCFNDIWPGDGTSDSSSTGYTYMKNLGTDFANRAGLGNADTLTGGTNPTGLNIARHYYGQQRQAQWVENHVFLLGEQEISNPQNTFTIGNGNSCQFLPLFKRSPICRVRESTPGSRNTWWTGSRDCYYMYTYNVNDLYFYNRAMIMLDILKPHNEDKDNAESRGVV